MKCANNPHAQRVVTVVLFAIYGLLLTGLILFKFPFSYQVIGSGRVLNLIPFAGSFTKQGSLRLSEIVENVALFVPFGVYLSMVRRQWSWGYRILAIVCTTVAFESIQYAFAIGRADITDVLGNTLGGVMGIALYAALTRILGPRTDRAITIGALVLTLCAMAFWLVLLARTWS